MSFQLIVPPIVETECTGFFGAVEKRFRGSLYRIEFWRSGASLTRDGATKAEAEAAAARMNGGDESGMTFGSYADD